MPPKPADKTPANFEELAKHLESLPLDKQRECHDAICNSAHLKTAMPAGGPAPGKPGFSWVTFFANFPVAFAKIIADIAPLLAAKA